LWSENRNVIPFYFSIREKKTWYPDFALEYYRAFASQYISFLERDELLVRNPISLDKIREYGISESRDILAEDVRMLLWYKEQELYDSVWEIAYTAPERFAGVFDHRILVIIDELQNITQYIYRDKACRESPDETLAGSFHDVVESKIAPMLVTGSYVGWLIKVINKYLEAGRLKRYFINPYLTPEHGLHAVYRYAENFGIPITNQTA
ncbi:MAG: hypothetical protein GY795_04405, partial [Desulfobacterales bacterium]|nr:hypothetical protein [Desulfobacterales bacterium]